MSRWVRFGTIALMLASVVGCTAPQPALQPAPPVAPQPSVDVAARNARIVADTDGAAQVFEVQADGRIRHRQSGMICPADFPNVAFWHAQIYPSKLGAGSDVGCDYGRNNANGGAATKLTIFATKAMPGFTLDAVFADMQRAIGQSTPGAKYSGTVLEIKPGKDAGEADKFPKDMRSAEYELVHDGIPYRTEVLVAIQAGWIIEVRATFPTQASGATEADIIAAGKVAVQDLAAPSIAFLEAGRSIAPAN
jgi:hypothetical protein